MPEEKLARLLNVFINELVGAYCLVEWLMCPLLMLCVHCRGFHTRVHTRPAAIARPAWATTTQSTSGTLHVMLCGAVYTEEEANIVAAVVWK